jgi:hypothetical protein
MWIAKMEKFVFLSELTDESQLLEQMLLDEPSEFENIRKS